MYTAGDGDYNILQYNYRPLSEASEGYVFTGVCHSVTERGGVTPNASWYRSHGRVEVGGLPPGKDHPTTLPPPRTTPPSSPQHTYRNYSQWEIRTHPTGMHSC